MLTFNSTDFTLASQFSHSNLGGGLTGTFILNSDSLQFSVVPEPGSVVSLLGGLGMLLDVRRFRRRLPAEA